MKALYQCTKTVQSLQRNITPLFALALLCFIHNLSAATKKT